MRDARESFRHPTNGVDVLLSCSDRDFRGKLYDVGPLGCGASVPSLLRNTVSSPATVKFSTPEWATEAVNCRIARTAMTEGVCFAGIAFSSPLPTKQLQLLCNLTGLQETHLYRDLETLLQEMTYKQRHVLTLLYGLGDGYTYSLEEVARIFKTTVPDVEATRTTAIRFLQDHPRLLEIFQPERPQQYIATTDLITQAKELTPFLISHLRRNSDDILKLKWEVFEHLIAEFFASWGFHEVRLVGRNASTSADIFAIQKTDKTGVRIRYFVEVKRWKTKVGVEVIDRVYGAMLCERPQWGWHLAMIVSVLGFKNTRKYKRDDLERRGIELRDKDDIAGWLRDYRPSDKGLWLPHKMFADSPPHVE